MTQASEVIAQQYAAAGINKVTWGSIGVNVKEFGAVGDGVTDDTQAFNRAMASITGEGTILLPPGTYRIASSMTIPSTICTYFTNGGMIAPGSGATVTINGEIIAELTQIFGGLGTVTGNFKVPCVYPQWWGAKGDGVTDDTPAIQAAVNSAAALGGGIVFVPAGRYLISSTINISKSVFITGMGKGSDTSNTNGSGLGITNFRWIGAVGGTMFYFKSSTLNNYLFGGGIESCLLDGAAAAATGIRGSSIGFMKFRSLEARSFLNQGIRIDADNGVLAQFNEIDDYHYVYGAGASTQSSHGLVLAGNTSAGVTQNHIISITALVYNGYAVRIEWSDNNIFEKLHAASLGTGGAVNFANGTGGSAAKNLVKYVVGKIYAESLTEGNIITYAVSEGGGLIADSGAQIHYEVQDYVNNRLFTTHKYIMSDQKDINIGAFAVLDGSASAGIAALQWPCLNLADGTDGRIGISVPPPYGWNKGTLVTLRIWFTTDTVNASKQWVATVRALTSPVGVTVQTPDINPNFGVTAPNVNIPVNNAQYINQYYDFPMNIGYDKDDYVFLTIQRRGADANDTALGNIQILGASLIYQAIGPDSPGSGTWAVTKPYYP